MNLIEGTYLAVEKPLLYIHIFSGFLSLSIAYLLLFIKKGNKLQKKLGMIYVYGMTTIFLTALPMSLLGEINEFLFVVAIFSFYLAFSGFRQGRSREGAKDKIDKALSYFILFAALGLFFLAITLFQSQDSMWITATLFGTISLVFGIRDQIRFRSTEKPNYYDRTTLHLILMLSATIATTTAFWVTVDFFTEDWLNWVSPNFVLVPVIIYFSKREKQKKNL